MNHSAAAAICTALLLATGSSAAEPAPAMDLTKIGPVLRKPTNEKQTRKEVEAFFKKGEEIEKAGDWDAALARVDFPVFMATDDVKGVPEGRTYSKDEYVAMIKPTFGTPPKDLKATHKYNLTVLSDSLVGVNDEWTLTQGKTRVTGRNVTLLVKRDGTWKVKGLVEAGWGGFGAPEAPAQPAPAQPAHR